MARWRLIELIIIQPAVITGGVVSSPSLYVYTEATELETIPSTCWKIDGETVSLMARWRLIELIIIQPAVITGGVVSSPSLYVPSSSPRMYGVQRSHHCSSISIESYTRRTEHDRDIVDPSLPL